MKVDDNVTIVSSDELRRLRLIALIGRVGTISEIVKTNSGIIRGYWVALSGELYNGEREWFIPKNSIRRNGRRR